MTAARQVPAEPPAAGQPPARSSLPAAVLRPLREGNAFESTVEQLATAIRLGVFAAGERLPPERELAERLRVGRATLRDAIGALRQAGLVTTTRGRTGGTVVVYGTAQAGATPVGTAQTGTAQPGTTQRGGAGDGSAAAPAGPALPCSSPELADVLTFRRVVEPGAAALAAAADLSAEQRAWLVEALEAAGSAPDDALRRVTDARLHLAIAALAGSPMLVDAVTQAQARLAELLAAIPVLRANIVHSDAQHAEIVQAVLAGDSGRAAAVMEQHCDATSALLRGLIG